MKLFGTDGIRGRANQHPITAELALRLGRAVADVLGGPGGSVVIGRDTRCSGPMLERAASAGVLAAGMNVLDAGVVPTPAVAHRVRHSDASAGIMITASHNPWQDNGLKVFGDDGYKLDDALEARIEAILLDGTAPGGGDAIGTMLACDDAAAHYAGSIRDAAAGTDLRGMKLVVDCGNGAASAIAPDLFSTLGAEVIVLGNQPDGRNINDGCGALHPQLAAAAVRAHGADLGVSLDGDADRCIFTDADGQTVSGDRILGLCAAGLQREGRLEKNTVVVTVMSNLGLAASLEPHGIRVETTAVGDRHVIERMRSGGFSFGGENSGHLVFAAHATTGDGILSALQVLRLMKREDATLAELARGFDEFPSRLMNLEVAAKPPLESLPALTALMREADAAFGRHGRHLIRYSGTESRIRILVEHRDAAECERWTARFADAVHNELE